MRTKHQVKRVTLNLREDVLATAREQADLRGIRLSAYISLLITQTNTTTD